MCTAQPKKPIFKRYSSFFISARVHFVRFIFYFFLFEICPCIYKKTAMVIMKKWVFRLVFPAVTSYFILKKKQKKKKKIFFCFENLVLCQIVIYLSDKMTDIMKELIFKMVWSFLEKILDDLIDDGKINQSVKSEIHGKLSK